MVKENRPVISDHFLDELAKEINEIYGVPTIKQDDKVINDESENKLPLIRNE